MQFTSILVLAAAALVSALPTPQDAPTSSSPAPAPVITPVGEPTTTDTLCQVRTDTRWTGGNKSSCIKGFQMASSYTSVSGAGCGIEFDAATEFVAAYYMNIDTVPLGTQNPACGQSITVSNPWTGKEIVVKVVDTCPTCSGVGSGITGTWANQNGATIDLSENAFTELFGGQTTGVFDVSYPKLNGGEIN